VSAAQLIRAYNRRWEIEQWLKDVKQRRSAMVSPFSKNWHGFASPEKSERQST